MQGWTMHANVWKIRVILLQIFVWIVDLKVREHLTEYLKKDIKYHRVIIGVFVWKRCCHKRFCWSKYLLWFYSTMYLILCVDDIIWCWGQKVFCPQLMSTNCSAASCSRNSANIRNPLICYTNHSFLMFDGSQVQKPYHASMNGFLTFWPWHHNIKIFVENSALFYYEKSKVYFKETRKAGCIWTWENP